MYNIGLFAEKVKPGLSDVFAEAEHGWWPKPIAGFQAASVSPVHREEKK